MLTIAVNTLSDAGTPSAIKQSKETLADAIDYLDAQGGGAITFKSSLSGRIRLTSPLPQITEPISIYGPGVSRLTIDGGGTTVDHPIFDIAGGVSEESEISGMTLTGGHASDGGAVDAASGVELYETTITKNSAVDGGGIQAEGADVFLYASTVSDNTASYGAAVDLHGSGNELSVWDSTVNGNTSSEGYGALDAVGSSLIVDSSTISGNTSGRDGGGLYGDAGVSIESSTVVGNRTKTSGGGGLFTHTSSDELLIFDSIIAGNSSSGNGEPDIANQMTKNQVAFSLIGDASDTGTPLVTDESDILGSSTKPKNPKLGPLANNGGRTKTMLPRRGSPVLDRGSADSPTDQRGLGRLVVLPGHRSAPGGDGSDIGAVEVQIPSPPVVTRSAGVTLTARLATSSCVGGFGDLPLTFSAGIAKGSGLKLKSVSFYVDPASHAARKPLATSTRTRVSPVLPMSGMTTGEHTLTAVVKLTARRSGHTVKRSAQLSEHFNVCERPILL